MIRFLLARLLFRCAVALLTLRFRNLGDLYDWTSYDSSGQGWSWVTKTDPLPTTRPPLAL